MKIAIIYGKHASMEDISSVAATSITDWADVTEKEYSILLRWVNHLNKKSNPYGDTYNDVATIVLKEESSNLPYIIEECKKVAQEFKEQEEIRKQEREKKKRERLLKKKAKTEEQEKKLLEELQAKYK